ncbi:MAG TPA: hypothetical protein VGG63_13955 [Steroidobacteraceae bacterium]|jgi:DNA-binding transcriptional LysR family regulator
MRSRHVEASLDAEEVRKILSICSPTGLLVGGQALAFWADHLQVDRPENLVSGVTADDVSLVVAHRRNLSPRVRAFMKWIENVLAPYLE